MQYMDQNVAAKLTGYEYMDVLTITGTSIPFEAIKTIADDAV